MQEELDQKIISLSVTTAKMTAKVFYKCIEQHLNDLSNPQGKQSLNMLKNKGEGLEKVSLSEDGMKEFKKVARKYGVDYAITKEKGTAPPKFHIHFKGKDETTINAMMKEAMAQVVKSKTKLTLLEKLAEKKDLLQDFATKTVKKVLSR